MILDSLILLLFFLTVIFSFKSVLLKIILLIFLYPVCLLFLYKYNFPMKGVLDLHYDFFSEKTKNYALYSACVGFLFFCLILFPIRNIKISYSRINIQPIFRYILAVSYVVAFVLTYPRAFNINIGINSGSICILISILVIASKKSRFDGPSVIHICALLFAIFMGERVDAMMALLIHFIFDKKNEFVLEENLDGKMFYPLLGSAFSIGIISELLRDNRQISLLYVFSSIVAQQTTVDVCYVNLTGWHYYLQHGPNRAVLLNGVLGFVPGEFGGVNSKYNYTYFLNEYVLNNPGGGLYYTEGVIAFGFFGVALYALLFGLLIRYAIRKGQEASFFGSLFLLVLLIMQLRLQWYGFVYVFTPFFLAVLLSLFFRIHYEKTRSQRML